MSVNQRVVTWMVCSTFSLASAGAVLAADDLAYGYPNQNNTAAPFPNTPANLSVRGPVSDGGGKRDSSGEITGLRLGSFVLSFETEAGISYTDNANYSSTEKSSDRIYTLGSAFELRSNWSRHAIGMAFGLEQSFYEKNSSENDEAIALSADARIDVTRDTNIELGVAFNLGQEDRNSIDTNSNAVSPTDIRDYSAHIELTHKINRVTLSMRGGFDAYEYDDTLLSDSTLEDNSDRSYVETSGSARVAYEVSPKTAVYSELSFSDRAYDRPVDDNGDIRNSQAYGVVVGVVQKH